jgi:hypothetical protein
MSATRDKVCASCGRRFEWRRRWARSWEQVRYCSQRCRRRRVSPRDRQLEVAVIELLSGRDGSICPSEAARQVGGEHWRPLMEPARSAARRLAQADVVRITQRGRKIVPETARGPIRIARGPRFGAGTGD